MRRYLEDLLAGVYPERRDVAVEGVVEIEGGWETTVYGFELRYREDGASTTTPLIARFYPGPRGAQRAAREGAILRAVSRAGIPVPAVEGEWLEPSPFGTALVVMERVLGVALSGELIRSHDLVTEMARCLVALHQVPISAVFDAHVEPFAEPGFVASEVGAMAEAIDRYGLDEFEPLAGWLSGFAPVEHAPSVLHNDYHPDNIIVRDRGAGLAILDWSFAGVGDYRLDLAWSAFWTGQMTGSDVRRRFLAAYGEVAGRSIDDLDYFEVVKLGARLLTIALWLKEAVELPVPKITAATLRGDYRPTIWAVYRRFRELTAIRVPIFEQL